MRIYHSSHHKNLKIISPQRTLSHDKYIGDFVFATYNKKLAVMYLATKGVGILMNPKKSDMTIVICANEKEYLINDRGGAIYELTDDEFFVSPQSGLGDYERVSKKPVKPQNTTLYDSSVTAFLNHGIKIYFVDEEMFNILVLNPKQSEIIRTLTPYKL